MRSASVKYPVKTRQLHVPAATYERDDLRDIKVNRTTRQRLACDKAEYNLKNLDELINPALDALRRERLGKKC